MNGEGGNTTEPWVSNRKGPFRTADGRYYCIVPETGVTYWVSFEAPASAKQPVVRSAAVREHLANKRPWNGSGVSHTSGGGGASSSGGGGGDGEEGEGGGKQPKLDAAADPFAMAVFQMPESSSVRVGESFQIDVPPYAPTVEACDRDDELLEIDFAPLTAPPERQPLPLDPRVAAAIAASAEADAAAKARSRAEEEAEARLEEELDQDVDEAMRRAGLAVGDACVAWGLNAGQRKQFKAVIVSTRKQFPPLLVRYVGDAQGNKNPLLMPEVPTAHCRISEISQWREPVAGAAAGAGAASGGGGADGSGAGGASGEGGGGGGGGGEGGGVAAPALPAALERGRRTTRPKKSAPELELVTEAHGIKLHLDPRRHQIDYSGTGYKGVFDDYWPSGYKRDKPYTCTHDGKYQGRFALVIEAALHYAKLELGMVATREELKEQQAEEQRRALLQKARMMGTGGGGGGGGGGDGGGGGGGGGGVPGGGPSGAAGAPAGGPAPTPLQQPTNPSSWPAPPGAPPHPKAKPAPAKAKANVGAFGSPFTQPEPAEPVSVAQ